MFILSIGSKAKARHQGLIPTIPAAQEAKIRRIAV
jgi:hypothetical protein